MKSLLLIMLSGYLFACRTEHEIQADVVQASLVKIEIVRRFPDIEQKMLTWRASDNVLYITYEPMNTELALGTLRTVMVRR